MDFFSFSLTDVVLTIIAAASFIYGARRNRKKAVEQATRELNQRFQSIEDKLSKIQDRIIVLETYHNSNPVDDHDRIVKLESKMEILNYFLQKELPKALGTSERLKQLEALFQDGKATPDEIVELKHELEKDAMLAGKTSTTFLKNKLLIVGADFRLVELGREDLVGK